MSEGKSETESESESDKDGKHLWGEGVSVDAGLKFVCRELLLLSMLLLMLLLLHNGTANNNLGLHLLNFIQIFFLFLPHVLFLIPGSFALYLNVCCCEAGRAPLPITYNIVSQNI